MSGFHNVTTFQAQWLTHRNYSFLWQCILFNIKIKNYFMKNSQKLKWNSDDLASIWVGCSSI